MDLRAFFTAHKHKPAAAPKAEVIDVDCAEAAAAPKPKGTEGEEEEEELFPSAPPEPTPKRRRFEGAVATLPFPKPAAKTDPMTARNPAFVVAWNINGLRPRLQTSSDLMGLFMSIRKPDVLFLSEVRLTSRKGDPSRLSLENKRARDEAELVDTAFRREGCFAGYKVWWCVSTRRYAGTAMLCREGFQPLKVWSRLPSLAPSAPAGAESCAVDGRVLLAEWPSFYTLHTYTPNNGSTPEYYKRRRDWDVAMRKWLGDHWGGGKGERKVEKPLVYAGDLNVAPDPELDLTHTGWMRAGSSNSFLPADGDEGNRGQPGCTPHECVRFKEMLEAGNLVDAFRHYHPGPVPDSAGPFFTWRGSPAKPPLPPEAGRYYGKGMRIDHVLVTEDLLPQVAEVRICGEGKSNAHESFLGSDHCPVSIRLTEAAAA
eukprot:Hpha_TRINITY_DN4214_c0_g1::TRINITY_DN4214_c0_g1_i1::g.186602::m.186602